MVFEKVHEVISFKQKLWLKPYIEFNTQKKATAEYDFDKELRKSINCSFYGKTKQNVRNRLKLDIIKKYDKLMKSQSKKNI